MVLLWRTSSPALPGDVAVSWVKVDLYLLNHAGYNCGKLARRVMAPAYSCCVSVMARIICEQKERLQATFQPLLFWQGHWSESFWGGERDEWSMRTRQHWLTPFTTSGGYILAFIYFIFFPLWDLGTTWVCYFLTKWPSLSNPSVYISQRELVVLRRLFLSSFF